MGDLACYCAGCDHGRAGEVNFGIAGAMSIILLIILLMIGSIFIYHVLKQETR